MKSVIKIEQAKHLKGTEQARYDFSKVTGKSFSLKPAVFFHPESGERFCNIIGGISYPTALEPGFVIILGVKNDPVTYTVIDVFKEMNVFKLIANCVEMRIKWGYSLDSRILPWWYGDQNKFQTLIIKASAQLERKLGPEQGFYVKDMVDLREKYSFPLYVRQLFAARQSGRLIKLSASEGKSLVEYVQGFTADDAEKKNVADYPAMGLLAGMIHSIEIERPWEEDVTQGEVFNIAI